MISWNLPLLIREKSPIRQKYSRQGRVYLVHLLTSQDSHLVTWTTHYHVNIVWYQEIKDQTKIHYCEYQIV
jgi:hypothetical protein